MENEIDLRKIRKARGWTQQEMGEHLGVNFTTVSRWEVSGLPKHGVGRKAVELLWKETFGTEATQ